MMLVTHGPQQEDQEPDAGLERAIAVHEEKIEIAQSRPKADAKRIDHWHSEIEGWKGQIERLTRRLRRG